YTDNFFTGMREYMMCTTMRAKRTNASLCRQCGKCEQHCPQGIAIRKELHRAARHLENPAYHVMNVITGRMFRK
ncbi:MAG: 4Fe-4S binding protein, partial [Eubacterium sp.]|nr:4Fe-4S binding protein [Eubacterium sp.]